MMASIWWYPSESKQQNLNLATMTEIFGDFIEPPFTREYLIIGFSPSSVPLKQRWRNNGLSADFLADYLTTFFPGDPQEPQTVDKQVQIKSAISYVANELLENAMKFNDEKSDHPISIRLHLESDRVAFLMTNSIAPEAVDKFQAYIQELTTSDPSEMYIEKLEKNASEDNNTSSGLGLLTMINDYEAQIGWKFETLQEEPKLITVTTMVQLTV
jgi:hypothetical protein